MIEVDHLPSNVGIVYAIDPGALGGWAYGYNWGFERGWELYACGLARTPRGERPPRHNPYAGQCCCIGELPQHQKKDTPKRTNDLFKTSLRLGLLAEATGAGYLWTRSPHSWKHSVNKDLHNARCRERLRPAELDLLNKALRGDGTRVTKDELNNVIDAIGIFIESVGRW
jgi:hypothetical protein